jgi:glycine cleavage system H protein
VYSPASGKVVAVNEQLKTEPSIVNKSPLKDAWMVQLELSNSKEVETLMDEAAYKKYCEEQKH